MTVLFSIINMVGLLIFEKGRVCPELLNLWIGLGEVDY